MSTVLREALKNVGIDAKKNDYSNFVWKGEKRKEGDKYVQEQKRLIDMSPEELKKCNDHCDKMLYNDDPKHLGRYNVLDNITDEINKCNIELLLRYFEKEGTKRYSLRLTLMQLMKNNPEVQDWSVITISQLYSNIPSEFNDITVTEVLDGCIDELGVYDKSHLTMTFITNMGLWFTKAEENELKGETNSNTERLRIAKERLHLPSRLNLRINEKGLSYHEMRAILVLPKKQKYSDMTTEQLTTLRNKILFRFHKKVGGHIFSWNQLKKQIRLVANDKGIDLND